MSSNSQESETETLFPSPSPSSPPPSAEIYHDRDEKDHPVQYDRFIKNVRICKTLLGLGLPVTLGLEVVHLVLSLRVNGEIFGREERRVLSSERFIDWVGIGFMVSFSLSLVHLFFRQRSPGRPQYSMISSRITVLLHLLPPAGVLSLIGKRDPE